MSNNETFNIGDYVIFVFADKKIIGGKLIHTPDATRNYWKMLGVQVGGLTGDEYKKLYLIHNFLYMYKEL